jgi:hypothetical protein
MNARQKIGIDPQLRRAASAAKRKYLLAKHPAPKYASRLVSAHPGHNVVGVGIGFKKVEGETTETACVRLYVRNKFGNRVISKKHRLPKTIGGSVTDVIEVGTPRRSAMTDPDTAPRLRPARPGCMVETDSDFGFLTPGTFGALLQDADGKVYILSANHVLAQENMNAKGSDVYQPSNDSAKNKIARLATFIPLYPSRANKVDCALAKVIQPSDVNPIPIEPMSPLSSVTPVDPVPGMTVQKIGIATDCTTGIVSAVAAHFRVDGYMTATDNGMLFEDQIEIEDGREPFCAHGDSGALVVDAASKQAVGLLAVRLKTSGLANCMSNVLSALSDELKSDLKLKIS